MRPHLSTARASLSSIPTEAVGNPDSGAADDRIAPPRGQETTGTQIAAGSRKLLSYWRPLPDSNRCCRREKGLSEGLSDGGEHL
jgi:hypothetical protein